MPNTALSLILGAGSLGTGTTTFTLAGSGKLIVSGNIQGARHWGWSAPKQVFNFQGGTLVANQVNATYLSGAANPTVQGTLYNTGGTLAPGDIGTADRPLSRETMSRAAVRWPSISAARRRPAASRTGQYDYLQVTGSATVGGALNVGLINGYVPPTGTNFTVLTAGSSVAGSFSNVASGSVLTVPGDSALFGVYYGSGVAAGYNSNYVTLTTIVGSNASIWNNTTGGTWGSSSNWNTSGAPNGAGTIVLLGTALTTGGTVALAANTTVGVLTIFNTAASYTVGPGMGPYSLTLNNGSSTAQINDFGGTHIVSAPITVAGNNNLNVTVYNPTDSLTFSGGISTSGTLQIISWGM